MSLAHGLLERVFGEVPEGIAALIDEERTDTRLIDFEVGPIFPFDAERGPRVAMADGADPARWERVVRARWPGVDGLLAQAPAGCRRMVDTDGREAVVYLDDLQVQGVPSPDWLPHVLMCQTWSSADGAPGFLSRHDEDPRPLLSEALVRRAAALEGAPGAWSVRWAERRPVSLLWISEARWRRNPDEALERLARVGRSEAWEATAAWLAERGMLAYPDAVEVFEDGRIDVTLGLLPQA